MSQNIALLYCIILKGKFCDPQPHPQPPFSPKVEIFTLVEPFKYMMFGENIFYKLTCLPKLSPNLCIFLCRHENSNFI